MFDETATGSSAPQLHKASDRSWHDQFRDDKHVSRLLTGTEPNQPEQEGYPSANARVCIEQIAETILRFEGRWLLKLSNADNVSMTKKMHSLQFDKVSSTELYVILHFLIRCKIDDGILHEEMKLCDAMRIMSTISLHDSILAGQAPF